MPTVTWLGSHARSLPIVEQFGVELEINKEVEVSDEAKLHKFWTNKYYEVKGWAPEGVEGEQPIRSREDIKLKPRTEPVLKREQEPPPLPTPEAPPEVVNIHDEGVIVDGDEDMPKVVKDKAQVVDLDGDGEPDIKIEPIEEEEPAPRRRRRRRT